MTWTLREEVAAHLLDRDEGGEHLAWARAFVMDARDAAHDGDCTNKCHTCVRCLTDQALQDADRLIETMQRDNGQELRPTQREK